MISVLVSPLGKLGWVYATNNWYKNSKFGIKRWAAMWLNGSSYSRNAWTTE